MRLCPNCQSLAYFNSYFDSFVCNSCKHMWKEKEVTKVHTAKGFYIKRHLGQIAEKDVQFAK